MTELLSPAGGREALVAAVQNGADAVYMGFGSFNARRSARNFSDEEFLAAVRYCHLRGVKVYLTLNTLVTDRELPALAETARRASEYGVDAILVQDWGVYETLRAVIPDVPLHASTQMSIHNLEGARLCEELGFVGAVVVILLFILLIVRGYYIAMHARDRFGSLLAVGVTTQIALQVFLNIAVVTNLIPNTGISLPFFSYGGTALLIQLAEMGVILSVSRQMKPTKAG